MNPVLTLIIIGIGPIDIALWAVIHALSDPGVKTALLIIQIALLAIQVALLIPWWRSRHND